MKTLAEQMSIYQRYHTKEITKMTHFVGVPCVIFAVLMLLSWVHISMTAIFSITLAWIVVFCILMYYLILDIILTIATAIILIPLTYLAQLCAQSKINTLSITIFLIFFIGGWIMQFIGHYFEGKKPAFMHNLFQVVVAPIFLIAEVFFALGYKKSLQQKVLELAKE